VSAAAQLDLFEATAPPQPLPEGWAYQPEFVGVDDEAELLGRIATLPLEAARYKGYVARRRVLHFGIDYDFERNRVLPAEPLPPWLLGLRDRCGAWAGVAPETLASALVAEYRPGTPLGWHRDAPDFETVVGVSLASACRMRLRRYPPVAPKKADVIAVDLEPRSVYVLRGVARWGWQHSIAATPSLRYSITFRTRSRLRPRAGPDD
jgi:alkylated DNA repair dioxygenase AlkB